MIRNPYIKMRRIANPPQRKMVNCKIQSILLSLMMMLLFVFVACGKDDAGVGGGNEVGDSVSDTTNGAGSYDGEIDWEW